MPFEGISGSLQSSHGSSFMPTGKDRGIRAPVMALLRVLEDQPWVIKNIFAGNPTGFPVM